MACSLQKCFSTVVVFRLLAVFVEFDRVMHLGRVACALIKGCDYPASIVLFMSYTGIP